MKESFKKTGKKFQLSPSGFTLIELLGVIVILGLLSLIIYPVVNNVIQNNKEKLYKENIDRIEKIAYNWSLDNIGLLSKETDYRLTLSTLKQEGYVSDKDIINIKTNEVMKGYVNIRWKEESNQFGFDYIE